MEAIPIPAADASDTAFGDLDEELAAKARNNPDAFAELYVRQREPVFRYLRARCRDEDDALELTAVTF